MRVFVTAVGIVSPLAVGAEATFQALVRGERAIRPITLFDVGASRSRIAAEVPALDLASLSATSRFTVSRVDAMAILAAREAIQSARLSPDTIVDLVTSGVQGGMFETEVLLLEMFRRSKPRTPDPNLALHAVSATADRLKELVFPFRRLRTVSSACSGGASAITLAEAWIRSGQSSAVLAGGADAICRSTFAGFHLLSSLDPEPCKPFDKNRAGLSLGEGAAYLLLESEEEVLRRGIVPLAELASSALGSEGKHIIQPEENGETLAYVLRQSLERAQLSVNDIGYVNAHGTASTQSDVMEAKAYHAVLGDAAKQIPVSSCKGQIGHSLGAAAAMEAAVTVLALHNNKIPPTGGLVDPDPRCDLLHVVGQGRAHEMRAAVSASAGFGGAVAALGFTRPYMFDAPKGVRLEEQFVVTAALTLGPLGFGAAQPSLEYLQEGPAPASGPSNAPLELLDADKIRRLDSAATRLVFMAKSALQMAFAENANFDPRRMGIVTGLPLRGIQDGAAFLGAVLESNFRRGRPLDFPGLLPSSPTSQASIYLALRGPSLTLLDRETSTSAALSAALDLMTMDHADAMIVAGLSDGDELTRETLLPLNFPTLEPSGPFTDGAGALMVERVDVAKARGTCILARIVARQCDAVPCWTSIPKPINDPRALVVSAHDDARLAEALRDSSWSGIRRVGVSRRAGMHEALGAIALVAAVQAIAAKEADEVLVVDMAEGRFEAFVFAAP